MKDFNLIDTSKLNFTQFSIFNDIAQALNLSFDIQPSSDGGKWGMVKKNDTDFTVTGIYGDLKVIKLLISTCGSINLFYSCFLSHKDKVTDIGFANLFIIESHELNNFNEYLIPHNIDRVCFLVKKPLANPKWMYIFISFQSFLFYTILTLCLRTKICL